jgi:hypothetical protein
VRRSGPSCSHARSHRTASGPKRFDYDGTHGIWFWSKEGQVTTLKELLDTELSEVFATTVEVDLEGED